MLLKDKYLPKYSVNDIDLYHVKPYKIGYWILENSAVIMFFFIRFNWKTNSIDFKNKFILKLSESMKTSMLCLQLDTNV